MRCPPQAAVPPAPTPVPIAGPGGRLLRMRERNSGTGTANIRRFERSRARKRLGARHAPAGVRAMNLSRLIKFLSGLKAHNRKPWFESHRDEYEELRSEFEDLVQQVILSIGKFEPGVRSLTPRECIYRIYRDTRFSKDKSPYKSSFGAAFSPAGRRGEHPGYHLHIDAGGKLMVAGRSEERR